MEESGDLSFDIDAFIDNISVSSVSSKCGEQRNDKILRNIKLAKDLIGKASHLGKIKYINKWRLTDVENELSKLSKEHATLLEKHLPLIQKLQETREQLDKLNMAYALSQTEVKALQNHNEQLEALIKELEEKLEGRSIENALASKPSDDSDSNCKKKYIKHIVLFGKLAAKWGKLNNKHKVILKKYLKEAGEIEEDRENDERDLENIAMPSSCCSIDTGISSSNTSDDEKLWSPDTQFTQHSYEEVAITAEVLREDVPPAKGNTKSLPLSIETCDKSLQTTFTSPLKATSSKKHIATSPHKRWSEIKSPKTVKSMSTSTIKKRTCEVATSPIFKSKITEVIDVNDFEVENILKEMSLCTLTHISPVPPTPLHIRKSLRMEERRSKQRLLKHRRARRMFNIVDEMRKLQVANVKLNNELCLQRKQLVKANKVLLQKVNTQSKSLDKAGISQLVSLMKLATKNRFVHNQDISENHSESENNIKRAKSSKRRIKRDLFESDDECITNDASSNLNKHTNRSEELEICALLPESEENVSSTTENTSSNLDHHSEVDSCNRTQQSSEVRNSSPTKSKVKKKKPTKLDKFKSKLTQKPKISSDHITSPYNKKDIQAAVLRLRDVAKKDEVNQSTATCQMNDEQTYQKALAVMSEINAKKKQEECKKLPRVTRSSLKSISGKNTNSEHLTSITKKCNEGQLPINRNDEAVSSERLEGGRSCSRKECTQNNVTLPHNTKKHNSYESESPTVLLSPSRALRSNVGNHLNVVRRSEQTYSTSDKLTAAESDSTPTKIMHRTSDEKKDFIEGDITNTVCREFKTVDYNDLAVFECDGKQIPIVQESKRMLRSSTSSSEIIKKDEKLFEPKKLSNKRKSTSTESTELSNKKRSLPEHTKDVTCHEHSLNDSAASSQLLNKYPDRNKTVESHKKEFFKTMLSKYGRLIKRKTNPINVEDVSIRRVQEMLEEYIGAIEEVPTSAELDTFIIRLKDVSPRDFTAAVVEFLMSESRNKDIMCVAQAMRIPHMTKQEQALLYILNVLERNWTGSLFATVMRYIEYRLLRLGHTPSIGQVENLSRFYAVICRFRHAKATLRMFMVEALYCMNYKALPLIQQCLNVWMHVIPLAHLSQAKTPLVMVLVYVIFYFRVDNTKSNMQVDQLKRTLCRKYFYNIQDFVEKDMLEKLRNHIVNLKEKGSQEKMLATALVLLAKRNGVNWCQKKIVEGLLMPIILDASRRECVRAFSISLLGSLLKPYPDHMRLHCEMTVNKLLVMLEENPSFQVEQAILVSLLLLRQHNRTRVERILSTWGPRGALCPQLQQQIKVVIQEHPLSHWLAVLKGFSD